jgi:HAD superfamily hydrolase (TIGR01549 family)
MEKKRFIFDLDRTLLTCNYEMVEKRLFEPIFGDNTDWLMENIGKLLDEYETIYPRYQDDLLSEYLTNETGLIFAPWIIEEWAHTMRSEADTMEDGVIEVLDYLKNKDKSLIVLTNWYGSAQIQRLKNANIYDYFDEVLTGEYQLKPHPTAFLRAVDNYDPRECVVIGDSISKDYLGPRVHGIESILYDKDDVHSNEYVKIKKLTDLKKRY